MPSLSGTLILFRPAVAIEKDCRVKCYLIVHFDRFTLNMDQVELTIEVTIIQDVTPQFSFCNPGDVIFQSFPENNTMNLLPLVCTNSSCGGVKIDPVILDPWIIHYSSVEATVTETPANPSYITIGEQFNMTIRACMPESWTGVVLNVTLPHQESTLLVTLNDAYVTYIGSELLNTTLMEDDSKSSMYEPLQSCLQSCLANVACS